MQDLVEFPMEFMSSVYELRESYLQHVHQTAVNSFTIDTSHPGFSQQQKLTMPYLNREEAVTKMRYRELKDSI